MISKDPNEDNRFSLITYAVVVLVVTLTFYIYSNRDNPTYNRVLKNTKVFICERSTDAFDWARETIFFQEGIIENDSRCGQ